MRNSALFFFSFWICFANAQTISINLESDWEFKGADTLSWMPAAVPGTVHTDLMANNVIEDPFKDNNEIEQQWIEKHNWEYRTKFEIKKGLLKEFHQELHFKGLDTYADVYLNGTLILEANNMFRSWTVNVDTLVKKGPNELRIVFTSPIVKNLENARSHLRLPGGSDTSEYPVAPFTRKAAYHFGWDWAPRFVTSGIWKNIQLVHWKKLKFEDIGYTYRLDNNTAKIGGLLKINSAAQQKVKVYLNDSIYSIELKQGVNEVGLQYQMNVERWWPNGSGDQKLYTFDFGFIENGKKSDPVDSQKIGFRTIELINEPDSIGTSFYFLVNNQPTFMKGANYVPQDVFLPRVKPEQYHRLLTQVKEAGMNMLRVWGGGVYEQELFYDLCDEYGILVWQDFMFANTLYPSDSLFMSNVYLEVIEQIQRISKHTCLALWCGNNEIEVAWKNWGWQNQYGYSPEDSLQFWNDYSSFFEINLSTVAYLFNRNKTPYVSTSPQSNWGTAENFNHGSMHYWGVWHGPDDFNGFHQNVGRFMAEWGFQSFPDYELLSQYVSADQLSLESEVMKNRQKSYIGNGKISAFMSIYSLYGGDASSLTFKDYITNSQWVQSLGYQEAIKTHLSKQPHCMGTLLWQLNDCWPGPSWSIINYDGKPKESYHAVKSAFTSEE
jgi:beta-mannosidase